MQRSAIKRANEVYQWWAIAFVSCLLVLGLFGENLSVVCLWIITALATVCFVGAFLSYQKTKSGLLAKLERARKHSQISSEEYNARRQQILENL
jgi:hypothetical protein